MDIQTYGLQEDYVAEDVELIYFEMYGIAPGKILRTQKECNHDGAYLYSDDPTSTIRTKTYLKYFRLLSGWWLRMAWFFKREKCCGKRMVPFCKKTIMYCSVCRDIFDTDAASGSIYWVCTNCRRQDVMYVAFDL